MLASKHAPVQRIPRNAVRDLSDLNDNVNSHKHIKGRFTVFFLT
jgi:hypothetical protein